MFLIVSESIFVGNFSLARDFVALAPHGEAGSRSLYVLSDVDIDQCKMGLGNEKIIAHNSRLLSNVAHDGSHSQSRECLVETVIGTRGAVLLERHREFSDLFAGRT